MGGPEKHLQDECIAWLKKHRIYYINQYGDGRTAKGKPDLICCISGRFVAFELKVGKNHMQDDQIVHMHRIEASGGLFFCVRSLDEFLQDIDTVKSLTS